MGLQNQAPQGVWGHLVVIYSSQVVCACQSDHLLQLCARVYTGVWGLLVVFYSSLYINSLAALVWGTPSSGSGRALSRVSWGVSGGVVSEGHYPGGLGIGLWKGTLQGVLRGAWGAGSGGALPRTSGGHSLSRGSGGHHRTLDAFLKLCLVWAATFAR